MTTTSTAATGEHTTDGLPHGTTSVTPHLVVSPAPEAIELYRSALGATVRSVVEMGGIVAHAELEFARGGITVSDPMPGSGLVAHDPSGPVDLSLALYLPDVDAAVEAMRAAGSTIMEEPQAFVSGDRFAALRDPYGVRWAVLTRVEDLSRAESEARVAEWAAAQG